jgi:hypothetical protein
VSGAPAASPAPAASGSAAASRAPAAGSAPDLRASLGAVERTYNIERYLGIRSASVIGLSPDGGTIAYLTSTKIERTTARPGVLRRADTFGSGVERSWSPRGDWIAFAKDKGR